MFRLINIARFTVVAAALVAASANTAVAQKDSAPKQVVTVQQSQPAFGQNEVAQLILVMPADKDGKVSREQFTRFMDAQFDLFDGSKTGAVDVKQVAQPAPRVMYLASNFGK